MPDQNDSTKDFAIVVAYNHCRMPAVNSEAEEKG